MNAKDEAQRMPLHVAAGPRTTRYDRRPVLGAETLDELRDCAERLSDEEMCAFLEHAEEDEEDDDDEGGDDGDGDDELDGGYEVEQLPGDDGDKQSPACSCVAQSITTPLRPSTFSSVGNTA